MQLLKLNHKQLDRLSEIFGNLGLALFISLVIPGFVVGQEVDRPILLSGLVSSFGSVVLSLVLVKGGEAKSG